jgi:hypothetical protein
MKYTRRNRHGGGIPGNATVAIQQDPLSPTILVSAGMAANMFEDRDPRITAGGRRRPDGHRRRSTRRRKTRRTKTGKN